MSSASPSDALTAPAAEPRGPGRRVLAFLFSLVWITPLVACIGTVLVPHSAILLLIPPAAWFASDLGRKAWLRFVTLTGTLFGGLFGHALEGFEGAIWGSLIGLTAGFIAAWYSLWLLRKIPDRWGSVTGWWLLGIAFTLIPLLLGIRLLAGRFDDDDSPFIILAIGYGIFHSYRKGWPAAPFIPEHLLPAITGWLRFWTGPRALPWVAAFIISSITAGPAGSHYDVIGNSTLSISTHPLTYIWPSAIALASIASYLLSRKLPPNPLHTLLCAIVLLIAAINLTGDLRYHVSITSHHLDIRSGLWKSVRLSREDLATIQMETFRARRVSSTFPILITRSGKRHSLRGVPNTHLIGPHLAEHWKTPILPPPPR